MSLIGVFAALPVSDLGTAAAWYEQLIGRAPDHRPMATLVQWVGPAGGLQLFEDPARAGGGLATLVFDDLAARDAALAHAGISIGAITRGAFGAVATLEDPDGNRIHLTEPPVQA